MSPAVRLTSTMSMTAMAVMMAAATMPTTAAHLATPRVARASTATAPSRIPSTKVMTPSLSVPLTFSDSPSGPKLRLIWAQGSRAPMTAAIAAPSSTHAPSGIPLEVTGSGRRGASGLGGGSGAPAGGSSCILRR